MEEVEQSYITIPATHQLGEIEASTSTNHATLNRLAIRKVGNGHKGKNKENFASISFLSVEPFRPKPFNRPSSYFNCPIPRIFLIGAFFSCMF